MRFALVKKTDAKNNRELLNASTSTDFNQVRTDDSGNYYFFSFLCEEVPEAFKKYPIFSLKETKEILKLTESEIEAYCTYRPDGRDSEGALVSRQKAAKKGWKAQFHCINIKTSTENGCYNKDRQGNDLGLCTYTMYDSEGSVTEVENECVETVVTWEPNFDIEIVGGRLLQFARPVSDTYLWVTAAPDIPSELGGNVAFTQGGINLANAGDGGEVGFDGRASKYIKYDPVYHSGKFEICVKHDAGEKHSFSLVFELFKE